jgi:hypothetical protein
MHIGTEVVHRIVATAFLGEQPSEKHIVNHIDTNRRNNRVENLRWVTKLDNILSNPVTLRRIEIAYGSVEAFFENPRAPVNSEGLRNFEWMRTVTKEEAGKSLTWRASAGRRTELRSTPEADMASDVTANSTGGCRLAAGRIRS